jgi:NAD(P)-dependent dehydrogenase (short-subunit alcohol dehydrogenase family)
MLLKDKVAVIYGAGGAIGGAAARAMARDGAQVFLAGRTKSALDIQVKVIQAEGGWAQASVVDATDEKAVEAHLRSVVDLTGRVDISFNAIGLHDPLTNRGVRFLDLDAEKFNLPVMTYARSYFLTARLAARVMIPRQTGVIMTVSALPARTASPTNGGYGAAQAAKEALTRDLSLEFAPQGLRVLCLRPHGMPETHTMTEVYESKAMSGLTWEQFQGFLASSTHGKRTLHVEELANVAVFMASDRAGGMTGSIVNLSLGAVAD